MYGKAHNLIPRQRDNFCGRSSWSQTGSASMVYVAMFDEVDEGTAISNARTTFPWENSGFDLRWLAE